MKRIVLLTVIINWLFINALTAQNPFKEFGVDVPVITLSKGKYPEFIPNDTIHRIGTVVIDTRTGKIIELINTDSIEVTYNYRPDVASRWISPDPLAEEFPDWSPYNYVEGNPIRFIDPDGRIKKDANGNIVYENAGKVQTFTRILSTGVTQWHGQPVNIYADDGTAIMVYKNVTAADGSIITDENSGVARDERWDTNCHGTTFADGQFWIDNPQASEILEHDNYAEIDKKNAKPNDVVTYHDKKEGTGVSEIYENNSGQIKTKNIPAQYSNNPDHSVTVTNVTQKKVMKIFKKTEITVKGLGGIQTKPREDDIKKAWKSDSQQKIWRKNQ